VLFIKDFKTLQLHVVVIDITTLLITFDF